MNEDELQEELQLLREAIAALRNDIKTLVCEEKSDANYTADASQATMW